MTIRGKAYIAGAYEHPRRDIPDRTLTQIHAEVALGAIADAGLTVDDVDGVLCDSSMPGFGPLSFVDYMGMRCSFVDSTETGGSSYIAHVGHAASAIAAGKANVVLITLAGKPRQMRGAGMRPPMGAMAGEPPPEASFEMLWGLGGAPYQYAMAATRHMYEFGTTSEQLAEIKVAASLHAQHNPNALLQNPVTVEEVLASPIVSDPLHRLDCCVITDGGGALIVTRPEIARDLARSSGRPAVQILGQGEAPKGNANGVDLTYSGAVWSGPRAFEEAGVTHADIKYASIYDSFTITVLMQIEDLGFCAKGEGGRFVSDGALVAPHGRLPFNTDGGGLCSNHPGNRGGMTKVIEAVRQVRGEAHPALQVPDCDVALAHGTGGSLGTRMGSATVILGREDA